MKKMISFVFLLAVFFCMEGTPQEPGDSKPLASKNGTKARRELTHEKRVKQRDRKLLARNEHHMRHQQKNTYSIKFVGRKKRHPGKHKEKNKEKKGSATIGESEAKK